MAGCSSPSDPQVATPPDAAFDAGPPASAPHPAIEKLAEANSLIVPLRTESVVHRWQVDPSLVITSTLVTLDDVPGALALYNAWIAMYGFMPAVDRTAVDLGDQAETLELGWPSQHQLIARAGKFFLLVESSANIPADARAPGLEAIAARTLPEQDG